MKKQFECGHSGKGKYCHRCVECQSAEKRELKRQALVAAAKKDQDAERKRLKDIRRAKIGLDAIDLSMLNHLPVMQDKARKIIADIASGASYFDFGGKRLISMQNEVLSIPIGDSFRLIYRVNPMVAVELLSHEAYNNKYVT